MILLLHYFLKVLWQNKTMTPQYITEFPLGYDEKTVITLTLSNDVVIAHPVMPTMIYDETVMRWVQLKTAEASHE